MREIKITIIEKGRGKKATESLVLDTIGKLTTVEVIGYLEKTKLMFFQSTVNKGMKK